MWEWVWYWHPSFSLSSKLVIPTILIFSSSKDYTVDPKSTNLRMWTQIYSVNVKKSTTPE